MQWTLCEVYCVSLNKLRSLTCQSSAHELTAMVTQHSTAAAAADTGSNDKAPLTKIPASRKGKGTHRIRIVKALLQNKENWKSVSCKDDYHFPGVFKQEQMQVVHYVPECTKLDQCCNSKPHFLWHDI